MPNPAGEARLDCGVAEFGAEGSGAFAADEPDVTAVLTRHDQMPVHPAAVGAQDDGAVPEDRVGVGFLLIFLPDPAFGERERGAQVALPEVGGPVGGQVAEREDAVVVGGAEGGAVGDLGDEGAVGLGQDDAVVILEGVDRLPAEGVFRSAVAELLTEQLQVTW